MSHWIINLNVSDMAAAIYLADPVPLPVPDPVLPVLPVHCALMSTATLTSCNVGN